MEQPWVCFCPTCGDEFSTPQQLALHRRENHPQGDTPYTPPLELRDLPTTDERGEVF